MWQLHGYCTHVLDSSSALIRNGPTRHTQSCANDSPHRAGMHTSRDADGTGCSKRNRLNNKRDTQAPARDPLTRLQLPTGHACDAQIFHCKSLQQQAHQLDGVTTDHWWQPKRGAACPAGAGRQLDSSAQTAAQVAAVRSTPCARRGPLNECTNCRLLAAQCMSAYMSAKRGTALAWSPGTHVDAWIMSWPCRPKVGHRHKSQGSRPWTGDW